MNKIRESVLTCLECVGKKKTLFCFSQKYLDCLKNAELNSSSYTECDVFIHESIKIIFTDK